MNRYLSLIALAVLASLAGCMNAPDNSSSTNAGSSSDTDTHRVNGSIHVPAGKDNTDIGTVNGSIHIDDDAKLTGASTVNGDIHLGAHATAVSLTTVNGSITLDSGAHVSAAVTTVNGSLALQEGSEVIGALTNVNGKISLAAAHVAGGIKTVNANIDILNRSRVEGGISVSKASNGFFHWGTDKEPRIVIGPGSTVQGDLKFERKVQLYVSDSATIGPVTGATAIKFAGDSPPPE